MPKVLLLADDPWVRDRVRAALSDNSWVLAEEQDPRGLADAIGKFDPDVVVSDLQVGSMGGMAVTREVRDSAFTGAIPRLVPVVMLIDRRADAFLGRRAGAADWLVKPFTAQELRRVLASVLDAGDAER